jgi:hypothetical protein
MEKVMTKLVKRVRYSAMVEKNTIRFYNRAIYKTFTIDIAISVENMEHVVGRRDIKMRQGR